MVKELGEFATPNDKFMRAPIALPNVAAEQFEIKPNFLLWFNKTYLEALRPKMSACICILSLNFAIGHVLRIMNITL
jgi:hypothetical protein